VCGGEQYDPSRQFSPSSVRLSEWHVRMGGQTFQATDVESKSLVRRFSHITCWSMGPCLHTFYIPNSNRRIRFIFSSHIWRTITTPVAILWQAATGHRPRFESLSIVGADPVSCCPLPTNSRHYEWSKWRNGPRDNSSGRALTRISSLSLILLSVDLGRECRIKESRQIRRHFIRAGVKGRHYSSVALISQLGPY
jgi:hypothetical protein